MNQSRFLRVVNIEKYQHYKDRTPPWIKLHASIFDDYEFTNLPDATKAHLMQIWIVASRQTNQVIPWDANWLAGRIMANSPIDLDLLAESGFIEPIESSDDPDNSDAKKWPSRYISDKVKAEVLKRDGGKCVACEATTDLEFDHILPVSRGGTGVAENIQILCRKCNRKKRNNALRSEPLRRQINLRSPEIEAETEAEKETPTARARARDGSKPVRNDPKKIKRREQLEISFARFWSVWPRKDAKVRAMKAWVSLNPNDALVETILQSVEDWREAGRFSERRFIPLPASWINGRRWEDQGVDYGRTNRSRVGNQRRRSDYYENGKPDPRMMELHKKWRSYPVEIRKCSDCNAEELCARHRHLVEES